MSFTHCPHCGARNFTMEGWEDLDHCSSCGEPLGEPEPSARDAADDTVGRGQADRLTDTGSNGANAEKPRPA
jgi:hypothetical protein